MNLPEHIIRRDFLKQLGVRWYLPGELGEVPVQPARHLAHAPALLRRGRVLAELQQRARRRRVVVALRRPRVTLRRPVRDGPQARPHRE